MIALEFVGLVCREACCIPLILDNLDLRAFREEIAAQEDFRSGIACPDLLPDELLNLPPGWGG